MEKYIKGKLKSIKKIDNKDTYDIQTSTKNFFANNVLVHNSEIILRDRQVCNLTEVVIRSKDTYEDLKLKVELATILGTFQATLTNFRYLSRKWKENTEEEALLGVSFTGIMDHPILSCKNKITLTNNYGFEQSTLEEILSDLRKHAVDVNKKWAKKLGINPAAAITCVKPSGTVSQLVDSASGIHSRFSRYYIRTVRADKKDPLAQLVKDQGISCEDDVTKPDNNFVFSFPIQSPKTSVLRDDRTALEQLDLWKVYAESWCEHKPSITVFVKENEWLEVGAWVYRNFDMCSGISFLPHSDHIYRQAPYQEITKKEYNEAMKMMPKEIDWTKIIEYEKDDNTTGQQELACTGGACEIL